MTIRSLTRLLVPSKLFYYSKNVIQSSSKNFITTKLCYRKTAANNSLEFDSTKTKLITKMNFKTNDDALPFYNLSISELIMLYKRTKMDEETGFCKNRLYYISERIQYPASLLSEKLAQRTFVYTLTSAWLINSLDVLLEYGVTGERIARDLWVLKYDFRTIRNRLERAKSMGLDKFYPWMVRCSEDILNRSIDISLQAKEILGDDLSIEMYLAKRLNISLKDVEEMCIRYPKLRSTRVTKVKSILDFLTSEGFELSEIVSKPRVIMAAQRTLARRIETLRALGVDRINLNVICRSVEHFEKYCNQLQSAMQWKK